MSTFAEIYSAAEQKQRAVAIHLTAPEAATSRPNVIHQNQIEILVQQLFFQQGAAHARHVGFSAAETSSAVSALCFDVASSLASQGGHDVALVDASLNSPALHTELGLTSPGQDESGWPIAPHLWLIDRGHWLPEGTRNITSDCVSRLREVLSEFDFSVLRYGAASSLSTNMAKACDGIVLVLAANKTRRLVAAQIKEQITKAYIPLLGCILADRKFPVPHSLYRNL